MKNKKSLLIVLCAVLLVCATVVGTLAYLTDRDTVTNTFTVGDVQITLDETKVKPDGTADDSAERVTENNYHLIPGKSYLKDPTMTVKADSEPAYVRMRVVINKLDVLNDIFKDQGGADLEEIFGGYDKTWVLNNTAVEDDTITYEFRYADIVSTGDEDSVLPALFTSINMPDFITGEQLAKLYTNDNVDNDFKITVYGDAIQAETFKDANDAWTAFDAQFTASK